MRAPMKLTAIVVAVLMAVACGSGGVETTSDPDGVAEATTTYINETKPRTTETAAETTAPTPAATTTTTTTTTVVVETTAVPATETETVVAATTVVEGSSGVSVAACMGALVYAEGEGELEDDSGMPDVSRPDVRAVYLRLLNDCSAEDLVQIGDIRGEPIEAEMAEFVISVYCSQLIDGGYEKEAASTGACDSAIVIPVVDVTVETTSDHCGQPAVGEPISGSGNDVVKVSFAEVGTYIAEITVVGNGFFAVDLIDDTGALHWSDGNLISEAVLADSYDGGKVRFQVETGGDFALEVVADADQDWEIRFSEF